MTSETNPTACRFAEDAPAYVLGQLTPPEAAAFDAHLASCDECAQRTAAYREIAGRLKSLQDVPLRRDLAPLVMSRLSGEASEAHRRHAVMLRALAAAALVLIAAGLLVRVAQRHAKAPTEATPVRAALGWLAAAQDASGAWKPAAHQGSDSQTLSVTALALYSMLKHPQIAGERHADSVRRGIAYLLREQEKMGPGPIFSTREQALATLALVRAAAVFREDAPLGRAAAAAVDRVLRSQSRDGSWGAQRGLMPGGDTSVTVWHLHALIEAESSGRKDLRAAVEKGLAWLKSARLAEGRAAYAREGAFPYGLPARSERAKLFLLADARGGRDDAKYFQSTDPLRYYFLTRGLEALGGGEAARWAGTLREILARQQVTRGADAGSWAAVDPAGGRVSSTALAALSFD